MSAPVQSAGARGEGAGRAAWVDLLLRPERFFPIGAQRAGAPLLALLVLALGASQIVERMDVIALRGLLRGGALEVARSWSLYWTSVVGGALVAGPLAYLVGGWWYGLRVRWSGAARRDSALARRVFLLTSSLVSIPTLVLAAWSTIQHPDPTGTWRSGAVAMTQFVAPGFSLYVSYCAVMTCFAARRGRALFWFVALPGLVYVAMMIFGGLIGYGAL